MERVTDRIKTICNKQAGTYETLNKVFDLNSSTTVSVNTSLLSEKYPTLWMSIPVSVLSVKMTDFKKNCKELLEELPEEVLDKKIVLSMGTIRTKTKI